MSVQKKAVQTVSIMFVLALLAKVAGQVREMMLAGFYGTQTIDAMAFSSASRIPLMIFEMSLGTAVSATFLPVFNEYLEKYGRERAFGFANKFISIITILSLFIAALGISFAVPIITMVTPNFDASTQALAVNLLRIMFPMMIFTAITFSLVAVLQSLGEFNIPAAISLLSNVVVIAYFIFLNDKFGIKGLAVSVVIGWLIQLVVLIPPVFKRKYRYRIDIDFRDDGIKKTALMAIPVLISSCVVPINGFVNMNLASGLNGGAAVTALDVANKLYLIVASIFTLVITNYIFPKISRLWAKKDTVGLGKMVSTSLRVSLMIVIPFSICFIILAVPIIRFIYQRGAFTQSSTVLVSTALACYSFGMPFYAVNEVLNKSFYAMQKSKIPMFGAAAGIGANIILSVSLVGSFKIAGLAISASLAAIIISIVLIVLFVRVMKKNVSFDLAEMGKILISAAIMAAGVFSSYKIFVNLGFFGSTLKDFLLLACSCAIGFILYGAALILLKNKDIKSILNRKKDNTAT